MGVSLSTTCLYRAPLERICATAAACGFDGIELVTGPETWAGGGARARRIADDHGLQITAVHTSAVGFCPGGRGGALIVDAARAAVECGAELLVVHYGRDAAVPPELDPDWVRGLEAGQALLDGAGARITLENQGTYFGQDPRALFPWLERLVGVARERDLLLTLDTCHLGTAGSLASEALALFGARLANVHLSDFRTPGWAQDMPLLNKLMYQHQMPAEGDLPLDRFLADLARSGYRRAVVCELSPLSLGVWSAARIRQRLTQYVERVRRAMAAPAGAPRDEVRNAG